MPAGPQLDAATVLLQWATGGLLFLWVTTRRKEVGPGYGWLLRSTYAAIAVLAAVAGFGWASEPIRDVAAVVVAVTAAGTLLLSITGRPTKEASQSPQPQQTHRRYDPQWDLAAPIAGLVGLIAAGLGGGGNELIQTARVLIGAAFLGSVTDAMLLGHWYLVQPGLRREPLIEQVSWLGKLWPIEVGLLLIPTGMFSVLSGAIDDSYGGMLGWFWVACALTTGALVLATRAALRERQYAAVMAATGLLYLAILTAFGTDVVARLVLET
ncbi:MAG: hypothetical protein VX760_05520 [Actinomycetota bacterium]|nr:hypothetical protein [Actinomycetota bacterium]MED5361986.1 hypothetical protein [Actinomycetota bacterium]